MADRSINVDQAKRAAELALFEAAPGGDASSIRAAAQKVQDLGGNGDATQADAADTQSRDRLRKAEADLSEGPDSKRQISDKDRLRQRRGVPRRARRPRAGRQGV